MVAALLVDNFEDATNLVAVSVLLYFFLVLVGCSSEFSDS